MRHPRLIPVLLLIIITSLATPLQAQIVLKGKITTEKNEPVAFAPVILQQLPDTTRYTEGVITDMAGNYRFGKHRAGRTCYRFGQSGTRLFTIRCFFANLR